ncbi:MAG TPA: response regulator, partial [Patescibacteria group bacterium]|nr:response regulator [Patescibacteria group bacterium]
MMILIVEGDIELAELLKSILRENGYEIMIANSGAEALELLEEQAPFIMLLDYSLADMNAEELINELHKREKSPPPFIISTGHGDERIAVAMMKLNARDYIIKDNKYLDNIANIMDRVAKEIENENKLKEVEIELRDSEKKYRNLSNQLETILDHIPGL